MSDRYELITAQEMADLAEVDRLRAALARVTKHSIIGVHRARQGAGQTLPEDSVLCIKCGWLRLSAYSQHLTVAAGEQPEEAPELFPGTRDALDRLTIRKDDDAH